MTLPHLAPLPAVSICEMQPGNIPSVCALAGRIWWRHYVPDIVSAQQIEYMLPRVCSRESMEKARIEKKQRFWLLYSDGQLMGYIAVEPQENNIWFIDKLYVDMDHQRQGFGGRLLQHITRELRPAQLKLRVNRKNYRALNFYFRNGFFIEALDVLDIGGGFVMDDFLMKKIL